MAAADDIQQAADRKQAIIDALLADLPAAVEYLLEGFSKLLLRYVAESSKLTLAQIASLATLQDLKQLIFDAGLTELSALVQDSVQDITAEIAQATQAAGLTVSATTLDEAALQALVEMRVRNTAERIAGPLAEKAQEAWTQAAFLGRPLPEAIAAAVEQAQATTPAQVETVIGTAVSSIDRGITAGVGEAQDEDTVWLYVGPSPQAGDKITRASCRHIVGKWAAREQIARLNNGQLPDVLVTGGGWNCRHSWAPMAKYIAEAEGIQQVSEADIAAFNAAGAR